MAEPLSPDRIVVELRNDLAPWITGRKGALDVSGDPHELIEFLSDSPRSFRVVIHWGGDKDQTGQEQAGIVTNTIEVFIVKAKGLKLDPGAHLIDVQDKNDPAFLRLLSDLRRRVRSMTWPEESTNRFVLYTGGEWVDLGKESTVVAFRLTFELITTIPYEDYR